jgi:hypothetical protein
VLASCPDRYVAMKGNRSYEPNRSNYGEYLEEWAKMLDPNGSKRFELLWQCIQSSGLCFTAATKTLWRGNISVGEHSPREDSASFSSMSLLVLMSPVGVR